MNRVLILVLVLGSLPTVAMAQVDKHSASAEQVLLSAGEVTKERTLLPVTLDFSLPSESEWLAKLNANPAATAPPDGSPAAAVLNASVGNGVETGVPPVEAPATGEPCYDCGAAHRWPPPGVLCKGTWEVEYGTMYWRNPIFIDSPFDTRMVPQIVRLGKIWNDPHPDRNRWRGSFEGLLELDCFPIVAGAGHIMIGGSGLIRYNLSWWSRRFSPYFQMGGGGIYTDAFMFPGSPTGSGFNFLIQFGLGSHFWLNEKWAFTAEMSYVHMSNAGIAGNAGYNILGGLIGLSRFFGPNVH